MLGYIVFGCLAPILISIYIYIYIYVYIYVYILGLRAIAIKFLKPIYFDFSWLVLNSLAVYFFSWQEYNIIIPSLHNETSLIYLVFSIILIINILFSFIYLYSYFFVKKYTMITLGIILSAINIFGCILIAILEFYAIIPNIHRYITQYFHIILILIVFLYIKKNNELISNNDKLLQVKQRLIKKLNMIVKSIVLIPSYMIIISVFLLFLMPLFINVLYFIFKLFNIEFNIINLHYYSA